MTKYIIRRLLMIIPNLLGVVFIVFFIMTLTPSSPGRMMLGVGATQEQVDLLNEQLGFNRPFIVRFADFLGGVLQGDFGTSYRTRQPVIDDLMARVPYTVTIGVMSVIFSSLIGISLGVFSAVKQYTVGDTLSTALAILLASIPGFWLAMLFMLLFSLRLGWLPSFGVDTWRHYIMPITVISLTSAAGLLRLTRTTMLETIRQDYIRTARAKGCTESIIIWKHALKNACLPVVTNLGLRFAFVLSGTIIIENIFGIPGVGFYMLQSINFKDIPAVVSATLVISIFFCLIMVLVDILYAVIDPRIRQRFSA